MKKGKAKAEGENDGTWKTVHCFIVFLKERGYWCFRKSCVRCCPGCSGAWVLVPSGWCHQASLHCVTVCALTPRCWCQWVREEIKLLLPLRRMSTVEYQKQGEAVGEGTYGTVWKGVRRHDNREIAMKKVLLKHQREGFPTTAIREIRALRKLADHPNIVSMYDVYTEMQGNNGNGVGDVYLIFEMQQATTEAKYGP
eukprot:Skav217524  [mRNA]  locus=scaffold4186:31699:35204:+ [translate_table: standard]